MVYTAVGAKCPSCARMPKSALARLKPDRLLLTGVIGIVAAVFGGYLFALVISMISFFAIIIAFALGAGVGEAVSRASGRYHGTRLAAWAAACAVLGVFFGIWAYVTGFTLTAFAFRFALSAYGIWGFVWMAAAAFGAWQRNA